MVEADLQDVGLDLGDDQLLAARSWPWLKGRIAGLLSADTRLHRALTPREAPVVPGPR